MTPVKTLRRRPRDAAGGAFGASEFATSGGVS